MRLLCRLGVHRWGRVSDPQTTGGAKGYVLELWDEQCQAEEVWGVKQPMIDPSTVGQLHLHPDTNPTVIRCQAGRTVYVRHYPDGRTQRWVTGQEPPEVLR